MSACRVVQAYISNYGDKLNIGLLLKNKYHIKLAQKEYGNHVIQCILEKNAWYVFSLWVSILSCRLDVHSSFHILRSGLCKKTEHFLSSTSKTLYKDSYIILSKPARNGHTRFSRLSSVSFGVAFSYFPTVQVLAEEAFCKVSKTFYPRRFPKARSVESEPIKAGIICTGEMYCGGRGGRD